jgi:hypothetical protein
MANFDELLRLKKENPELPIIPLVDSEVVYESEACSWWLGKWGFSDITRYYVGDERYYLYDEDDVEEVLVELFGWDWYDEASDEEVLEKYRNIPWIKCIAVYVLTPD